MVKQNRENQILDESSTLNAAPKIFKNDCKIDWANSLDEVYNKIRGAFSLSWSLVYSKE